MKGGSVGKPRVLMVDDDRRFLDGMEGVLAEQFAVTTSTSPKRALLDLRIEDFDVVCSDFQMPEMNGSDFLAQVTRRSPEVGCLLITGMSDYRNVSQDAGHFVIIKPFDPERLIAVVAQVAKAAQMRRSVRRFSRSLAAPSQKIK